MDATVGHALAQDGLEKFDVLPGVGDAVAEKENAMRRGRKQRRRVGSARLRGDENGREE